MYLFAATWILFIFGILAIVFFARGYPVVHTVYSALIALLFSVYLIYDTQQIMGGKKYEISINFRWISKVCGNKNLPL